MSAKKVIAKTTGDQKPQMTSEEKIEAGKAELMKVVEGVSGAEKVAELLEKGKKKGKLTSGELMDVLEDMDLDSEPVSYTHLAFSGSLCYYTSCVCAHIPGEKEVNENEGRHPSQLLSLIHI